MVKLTKACIRRPLFFFEELTPYARPFLIFVLNFFNCARSASVA